MALVAAFTFRGKTEFSKKVSRTYWCRFQPLER
jgi:hypothetical protein